MSCKIDRIRHVNQSSATTSSYTYYPVLIIGAGESGIAMGSRLRQVLGFDQFRIFDRKSGLGGTWHSNRYPGIACDVPAVMYSFSFAQNPNWTSLFPSGSEIVRYLYDVCERFNILDKIELNTSVKRLCWLDDEEQWEIILEHLAPGIGELATYERLQLEKEKGKDSTVLYTEVVRAKIVVSAVGSLVEPKPPISIRGVETFEGEVVHTARWKPGLNIKDKEVVVIGTGCSAAQVVPQLLKPEQGARRVTQVMRSPPWVVKLLDSRATKYWEHNVPVLCKYVPGFQNALRKIMFTITELEFIRLFHPSEAARRRREIKANQLRTYLHNAVPEKYHEILTPDYEVFCKRRIVDEGWFDSLKDPRVELTTLPVTSIQPRSVTLGPGRHYPPLSKANSKAPVESQTIPADIIIMANGYETNQWLHPLHVVGRGGRSLSEVWAEHGGPQAYMGTAMSGFPNLFLIFGPNTGTGHSSVILTSENMVNYCLKFIKPILDGDVHTYEVKASAERKWTHDVQRELKRSVYLSGGCHSYYVDENGWNSVVYPRTQIDFTLRCWFPRWRDWTAKYTRKGLVKLTLGRTFKVLVSAGALWSTMFVIRNGRGALENIINELVERAVSNLRIS